MKKIKVQYMDAQVTVNCPDKIAATLRKLGNVNRGRFAYVTDHVSGTAGEKGCKIPAVSNILFTANPRYDVLLKRQQDAINGIPHFSALCMANGVSEDQIKKIEDAAKAKGLNLDALFDEAKAARLKSIKDSMEGGKDPMRDAARECYAYRNGWRLHLATVDVPAPTPDKPKRTLKRPGLDGNGLMTVNSIMLPFFVVRRTYTVKGEWANVNSAPLTLMKDAIDDATDLPEYKAFSLCNENYGSLTIDAHTIYGSIPDKSTSARDTVIAAICGLPGLPLEELAKDASNSVGMPVEEPEDEDTASTPATTAEPATMLAL